MAEAVMNATLKLVQFATTTDTEVLDFFDNVPERVKWMTMLFLTSLGCFVNVCFVASFCVEENLMKFNNIYLCCSGVVELLVTAVVMVMKSMAMMSSEFDTRVICSVMQIMAQSAMYAQSLFYMLVSYRNLLMLRGRLTRCKIYVNIEYAYVPLVMYIVCCIYAFVGVLNKYDYDFCRRKHDGDYIIKLYTMGIIHGIPAILTVIFYYAAISAMKDLVARPLRRAANYYREFPMVFLNLIAFVVFVVMWLPFTIATIVEADERHYLYSSRFGLLRSVFVNLLYPIAHIDFRNAFICIFEYCFCRYTLEGLFFRRPRIIIMNPPLERELESPPVEQIEMHIIDDPPEPLE